MHWGLKAWWERILHRVLVSGFCIVNVVVTPVNSFEPKAFDGAAKGLQLISQRLHTHSSRL